MDVAGSVALVTGGGRGLGRVLGTALAAAGCRVGFVARSAAELAASVAEVRAAGGVAAAATADVSSPTEAAAAIGELRAELGPVDLLVNNAGVSGTVGPMWTVKEDEWWRTIEVNLRGVGLCSRAVLPEMVERRRGRIVTITSNAGVHRWPWATSYAVSKAAAVKLTENLAIETARYGVRMFSVDPGLLRIGLSDAAFSATDELDGPASVTNAWVRREIAAGRGAEPEQAVRLVHRIAAGDVDGLSGRHLSVHDDLDAMLARTAEVRRDDLHVLRIRHHRREAS